VKTRDKENIFNKKDYNILRQCTKENVTGMCTLGGTSSADEERISV
jgi:hypothetical protein